MREFIDLYEIFTEEESSQITILIPDELYQKMSKWMHDYEDIDISPDKLKTNPRVNEFIKNSIQYDYFENTISTGWENGSLSDEFGYGANIE